MLKEGNEFYFITKYPIAAKPFYTMPEEEKNNEVQASGKNFAKKLLIDSQTYRCPWGS
jgi:hypothetical protein